MLSPITLRERLEVLGQQLTIHVEYQLLYHQYLLCLPFIRCMSIQPTKECHWLWINAQTEHHNDFESRQTCRLTREQKIFIQGQHNPIANIMEPVRFSCRQVHSLSARGYDRRNRSSCCRLAGNGGRVRAEKATRPSYSHITVYFPAF